MEEPIWTEGEELWFRVKVKLNLKWKNQSVGGPLWFRVASETFQSGDRLRLLLLRGLATLYLCSVQILPSSRGKTCFDQFFFSSCVIFRFQQYSLSGDLGRAVHSVSGHVEPGMYTCRAPYWVTSLPWRWWGGIFPWKTDTKHYKEATKLFLKGDQLALAIEAVGSPPVSLVARSVWSE